MKSILENQTIRIDNHLRGGVPIDWDDPSQDIHLHKSQNSDKKQLRYEIRIPLNTEREITINGDSEPVPSKLKKEIEKAFEDHSKKQHFIDELEEALRSYNWNEKDAPKIARKISIVFGFNADELINTGSPYCLRLISAHRNKYQVFVNARKQFLIIGEFQPFSANGLKTGAKARWNEYLFSNISNIISYESQEGLNVFLKDAARNISGIGIKTVEDTIARIQNLYEIFSDIILQ